MPKCFSWGYGGYGQLGNGTDQSSNPSPSYIGEYKAVSSGYSHTLAIGYDENLYGWGSNDYKEVANIDVLGFVEPTLLDSTKKYKQVGAGYVTSFALTENGDLYGFGRNHGGELGLGHIDSVSEMTLLASDVKEIFIGYYNSMLIKNDHTLWVAGYNSYGSLGAGHTSKVETWTKIADDVLTASTAEPNSLFVKRDGSLWGMGENWRGELGLGNTTSHTTPVLIDGVNKYKDVAAGRNISFAVRTNGDLYSAGNSTYNGLGLSSHANQFTELAKNVEKVDSFYNSVAYITKGADLYTFGYNSSYGVCGLGITDSRVNTPQKVDGMFENVSVGYYHMLALEQIPLWSSDIISADNKAILAPTIEILKGGVDL